MLHHDLNRPVAGNALDQIEPPLQGRDQLQKVADLRFPSTAPGKLPGQPVLRSL